MINTVPYNVTVPEFLPERRAPIFPQIVRKYPCQQNKKGHIADWGPLTWKIQQPDPSMVWSEVKLVLPLEMYATNLNPNEPLDMRVSKRLPACNIAVAESPMEAFTSTSLSLNGRIFSEVNNFRNTLDACYRGTGPTSYGDNHSLKPVVCRDMKDPGNKVFVYQADGTLTADYLRTIDVEAKTIDAAFSLLEHNGPFIERARIFQDQLSLDGKLWTGEITNYLELGPFQARSRKGNTAVPYIRDFHLLLNFAKNVSQWDNLIGTDPLVVAGVMADVSRLRTVPCKLFEFGTVPNLRHNGEEVIVTKNFINAMTCTWTEKPYLEVTYTRFIEPMKPTYSLRCFERQYEKSKRFFLHPQGDQFGADNSKLVRITSRLLSFPTKIYLWAELADTFKGTFIFGNCRRSCVLNNIHCRLNQRPDIVIDPSQEKCYEMFQRHTNSSIEYGSWRKSPIYCFTPTDLQQADFLANDARLSIMEWDCQVDLTPLQWQEQTDSGKHQFCRASGYLAELNNYLNMNTGPDRLSNPWTLSWDAARMPIMHKVANTGSFILSDKGSEIRTDMGFSLLGNENPVSGSIVRATTTEGVPSPTIETLQVRGNKGASMTFNGFIWAAVGMDSGKGSYGKIKNNALFYIPQSFDFHCQTDDLKFSNPFSVINVTTTSNADPDKYEYSISASDTAALNVFTAKFYDVMAQRLAHDGEWINPTNVDFVSDNGNCAQTSSPGLWAYVIDKEGLRNKPTQGTPFINPGPIKADATNFFFTLDQRASNEFFWICFNPNNMMVSGGGADAQYLIARVNSGNDFFFQQGLNEDQNVSEYYTHGEFHGHLVDYVARGYPNGSVADDTTMLVHPNARQLSVGFDYMRIDHQENIKESFDYQLKVLYEFGNAQYSFSAGGLPTKVLPNLVPVHDSSAIPRLQ